MTKDDKIAYSNMIAGSVLTALLVGMLWLLFGCTADLRPDAPSDARSDSTPNYTDSAGASILDPIAAQICPERRDTLFIQVDDERSWLHWIDTACPDCRDRSLPHEYDPDTFGVVCPRDTIYVEPMVFDEITNRLTP